MLSERGQNARLQELNDIPYTDPSDGSQTTFAELYVRECINSICRAHQRQNPMPVDERRKTAELVVKYYGEWLIDEVKLFEERLDMGFLGIRNMNGQMEYDIKAIDRSNLLRFFKAYAEQRAPSAKQDEPSGEKTIEQLRQEDFKRRHPCPYNCYSDFRRTHDADRNPMPKGWDFEGYWTWWHETHDINRQLISPEEQATRNHYAYWHRTLKEWDTPDLQAFIDRVYAQAAPAYPSP
ncbi:MAG: hypothetical protein IKN59_00010 [Paludibacteraceae bacterium]|nr:hypothetical protein [Paludibacteraceae bacterium]